MTIEYFVEITDRQGANTWRLGTEARYDGSNYYKPRLAAQPEMARWWFSALRTRGISEVDAGSLRIENGDGAYDFLQFQTGVEGGKGHCFATDGATVYPLFDFVCDLPQVQERLVVIPIREWMATLEKPLVTTKYAGTNSGSPLAGIEGTADDIKGRNKPVCLGDNYNLTPICVNTDRRIYQVDGINGLLTGWSGTVYDRRSAITAGANYTSQSDMETNAPSAGQVRWWPAGGCFRLGSVPVGRVTADVINPPSAAAAVGQTVNDAQYIIERLLSMNGSMTEDERIFLLKAEPASGQMNQRAGIYITEEISVRQALSMVAGSLGLGLFFRPAASGTPAATAGPRFRRLRRHDATGKTLALTDDKIIKDSLRPLRINDPEHGLPVVRYKVGWRRNYTPMSKTDAPGATDAVIAQLAQAFRYSTGTGSQLGTFADGPELILDTVLADANAGGDMLNYLGGSGAADGGIYDLPSQTIALQVAESVFLPFFESGSGFSTRSAFADGITVTVTSTRFGLNGQTCLILGYAYTGRRTVELTLWSIA